MNRREHLISETGLVLTRDERCPKCGKHRVCRQTQTILGTFPTRTTYRYRYACLDCWHVWYQPIGQKQYDLVD